MNGQIYGFKMVEEHVMQVNMETLKKFSTSHDGEM